MGQAPRVYQVDKLTGLRISHYREGDIFITPRTVTMVANGKLQTLSGPVNLKGYVKKEEVAAMISDALKGVKSNE